MRLELLTLPLKWQPVETAVRDTGKKGTILVVVVS